MKAIAATTKGTTMTSNVKLRLPAKKENNPRNLGGIGRNRSFMEVNLAIWLTNLSEEIAAKQGLRLSRVMRERKLIWITAIISTPTIFPEITPKTNSPRAAKETALPKFEIILWSWYT